MEDKSKLWNTKAHATVLHRRAFLQKEAHASTKQTYVSLTVKISKKLNCRGVDARPLVLNRSKIYIRKGLKTV